MKIDSLQFKIRIGTSTPDDDGYATKTVEVSVKLSSGQILSAQIEKYSLYWLDNKQDAGHISDGQIERGIQALLEKLEIYTALSFESSNKSGDSEYNLDRDSDGKQIPEQNVIDNNEIILNAYPEA